MAAPPASRSASAPSWKEALQDRMDADWSEEIDDFESQIALRKQGRIEDTPDLMRRLAAVDITTREACGNSVRNVTACPLAGVCKTEAFDIAPYA